MFLTARILDILSVLRIVGRIGSSLNLIRIHTLLDEEVSNLVSTSLSKVAVVLLSTQVAGVTFNDEFEARIRLQDSNTLVDVIIFIGDLRNILVKVE